MGTNGWAAIIWLPNPTGLLTRPIRPVLGLTDENEMLSPLTPGDFFFIDKMNHHSIRLLGAFATPAIGFSSSGAPTRGGMPLVGRAVIARHGFICANTSP